MINLKTFLLVALASLLVAAPAQAQFSAETAAAVHIQTAKQGFWHSVMKGLQQVANERLKRSAQASEQNLGLQRKWFDALEQISQAVRNYKRIKPIMTRQILIMEMQQQAMQRFSRDENFTLAEIRAIGRGYQILIEESLVIRSELKIILKPRAVKMTDAERIAAINRLDQEMKTQYGLTRYYTEKNMAISRMRAEEKSEIETVQRLYGIR
ncbi:MAG: hypothetical protein HC880_00300 [Bacteroidia bacterium]|nr:hypothetical protein [Bacteroidia bacterium]